MKHSGSADLALMGGYVPTWLFERMTKLSHVMVEAILMDQGKKALLAKMSDPFWFQSFGAVIGMDWNSSGVTTTVLRALKTAINPHAKELGIYICGGKGKHSLKTPNELLKIGEQTGLNAHELVRCSKLSAKVDNTAVQDGYNLYIHSFILSNEGDWTVIQQGMKPTDKSARRYHWHSANIASFISDPHAAICGEYQGEIFNLVDKRAAPTQRAILDISNEKPEKIIQEIPQMILPKYKGVRSKDVDLKRLGSILWLAQESEVTNFEELLLLKGLGPRTLQSLALVSEVMHGTPSRFSDPARFTFAHGSKGGNPFPVPTKVYDETINTLRNAVEQAKMGHTDKQKAIAKLSQLAQRAEEGFQPTKNLDALLEKEKRDSWKHGGRTIEGYVKKPKQKENSSDGQLSLF